MKIENKKVILLTWVSWSGKSSIVDRLKKQFNISQPIQFTTRSPRNDDELDTYCFLSKEQFMRKLENDDFSEFTYYNGNWYWISSFFNEGTSIVIVEPVGAAAMKKFLWINKIPHISVYLDITPKTMEERLGMMRRESVQTIEERKKDFLYFNPSWYTYVVDANGSFEEVYRHVAHILKTNNVPIQWAS
jgi:guanylate kinase